MPLLHTAVEDAAWYNRECFLRVTSFLLDLQPERKKKQKTKNLFSWNSKNYRIYIFYFCLGCQEAQRQTWSSTVVTILV